MTGLNTPDDIPAGWREILSSIQAVCPSAVLAGGCLRDRDNGRAVKDLDIFINAHCMQLAEEAVQRLRDAGYAVRAELSDLTAYPEDQNLEVVLVAEVVNPLWEIQLIFVNWDTARIVERFDYGICRVAFDGTTITRPPEYFEDREKRVFRLRRDRPTAVSMRGSIHRYARLVQKYEGWTWWPYEPGEDFLAFA